MNLRTTDPESCMLPAQPPHQQYMIKHNYYTSVSVPVGILRKPLMFGNLSAQYSVKHNILNSNCIRYILVFFHSSLFFFFQGVC